MCDLEETINNNGESIISSFEKGIILFRVSSIAECKETAKLNFTFSSAWEYMGEATEPIRNKEELTFDTVHLTQRSYK